MLDFYLSVPVWAWCLIGCAVGALLAPVIFKRRGTKRKNGRKGDRHEF